MKSQNRFWIIFAVLFFFLPATPAGPFASFASMVVDFLGWLASRLNASAVLLTVLVYSGLAVLLGVLLFVGRTANAIYVAGICALITFAQHVVDCIRRAQTSLVSLTIVIGLALALLFLIIRPKGPALWLADAYSGALAAWIAREAIAFYIFNLLSLQESKLALLLRLPRQSLLFNLSGLGGLPLYVWLLFPLAALMVPTVLLAPKRQRG